ncbi:MAG: hypothetical protein ACR2QC_05555 [Gammaproteobacteria bacterium]
MHSPPSYSCIPRPIPAKAGISAAAKRRVIVRLRRQFAPSARRFLPSQEWKKEARIGRVGAGMESEARGGNSERIKNFTGEFGENRRPRL